MLVKVLTTGSPLDVINDIEGQVDDLLSKEVVTVDDLPDLRDDEVKIGLLLIKSPDVQCHCIIS